MLLTYHQNINVHFSVVDKLNYLNNKFIFKMTFLLQERCCLAQFSVISVAAQLRTQLPVIQSSEKSH